MVVDVVPDYLIPCGPRLAALGAIVPLGLSLDATVTSSPNTLFEVTSRMLDVPLLRTLTNSFYIR